MVDRYIRSNPVCGFCGKETVEVHRTGGYFQCVGYDDGCKWTISTAKAYYRQMKTDQQIADAAYAIAEMRKQHV